LWAAAAFAQPPLPELRTEPTDGGSVFHVRNRASQPITAFLIELVDYPGSAYTMWEEDIEGAQIAPGAERRIPVTNMTVGAVPDYVKLQAAIFADGTSAGVPAKVAQILERRRFSLQVAREMIQRVEAAKSAATSRADFAASLRTWAESIPRPDRSNRNSPTPVNQAAGRALILETADDLERSSLDEILTRIRKTERALAASKPAL